MNETTFYRVSWTRTGAARPETKEFLIWDAALACYEDALEDRRTVQAKLTEVTEKEVRCVEHEEYKG